MKCAIDDVEIGNLTGLLARIKPAITATKFDGDKSRKNPAYLDAVARTTSLSRSTKSGGGPHAVSEPQYLRVLMASLRKKIEPDPAHPKYVMTEPWVGYRFREC